MHFFRSIKEYQCFGEEARRGAALQRGEIVPHLADAGAVGVAHSLQRALHGGVELHHLRFAFRGKQRGVEAAGDGLLHLHLRRCFGVLHPLGDGQALLDEGLRIHRREALQVRLGIFQVPDTNIAELLEGGEHAGVHRLGFLPVAGLQQRGVGHAHHGDGQRHLVHRLRQLQHAENRFEFCLQARRVSRAEGLGVGHRVRQHAALRIAEECQLLLDEAGHLAGVVEAFGSHQRGVDPPGERRGFGQVGEGLRAFRLLDEREGTGAELCGIHPLHDVNMQRASARLAAGGEQALFAQVVQHCQRAGGVLGGAVAVEGVRGGPRGLRLRPAFQDLFPERLGFGLRILPQVGLEEEDGRFRDRRTVGRLGAEGVAGGDGGRPLLLRDGGAGLGEERIGGAVGRAAHEGADEGEHQETTTRPSEGVQHPRLLHCVGVRLLGG
ncbi:MAG: hypothetical protein BWY76_01449 [bacterium ADurb.Bin429]|nr:MAG: hypothetical protein BWY76_01449 [bacterium ADurb.Bin429]